jgi:hypothetical protein
VDHPKAEEALAQFIELIDEHSALYNGLSTESAAAAVLDQEIRRRLPTMVAIGNQVWPNFGETVLESRMLYPWVFVRQRMLALHGFLRDATERQAIVGPVGPGLSASSSIQPCGPRRLGCTTASTTEPPFKPPLLPSKCNSRPSSTATTYPAIPW